MKLSVVLPWMACVAAACGGSSPEVNTSSSGSEPSGWPTEFVTGPGTGPALYLHEREDAPAIGYVSEGVRVSIYEPPRGDRVRVRIRGPLKVRAWLSSSRLAARVMRRGKIRGTPAYVGPGDLVQVLGPADDPGRLNVEVTPWFDRLPTASLGPYTGTFPRVGLSAEPVPGGAEPPREGTSHVLPAGQEVPIYDKPDGAVVATLPALEPPLPVEVLRERGAWKGVRVGDGPYVVGYVNAELQPATGESEQTGPSPDGTASKIAPGEIPQRLQAEEGRTLWRLPEGSKVRFQGQTIAIVASSGFAREMNRFEDTGEVDVFAAVDNDVAVRGMVRLTDLQAAEAPASSSPASSSSEASPSEPSTEPVPSTEPDAPAGAEPSPSSPPPGSL